MTLPGNDAFFFLQPAWKVESSECPGDLDLSFFMFFGKTFALFMSDPSG